MNKSFSIKKARRLLGKKAQRISDKEIQAKIDAASLLKELFFDNLLKEKNNASQTSPNVP